FRMSDWDRKLLKYGDLFESQMMNLKVNIPLEEALDKGWKMLGECFHPEETSFRTDLLKEFWPK
ncbi:MAG: V-type ATP synthase subunit B, partial [Candidatus Omnitrophota bacterium]